MPICKKFFRIRSLSNIRVFFQSDYTLRPGYTHSKTSHYTLGIHTVTTDRAEPKLCNEDYDINKNVSDPIKVCHSPTNRYYKGSDDIINVCYELERAGIIQFVLVEGKPQKEVIRIKNSKSNL